MGWTRGRNGRELFAKRADALRVAGRRRKTATEMGGLCEDMFSVIGRGVDNESEGYGEGETGGGDGWWRRVGETCGGDSGETESVTEGDKNR